LSKGNRISRDSIQRLDLFLLALETIDLNSYESFFTLSNSLNLTKTLSSKVAIWKLRNNNPLRKAFSKNDIKSEEFEALIRLTAEMSRFLYPYIREILQSKDDTSTDSLVWIDFKERYIELINERLNINSMKVKKILNPSSNDQFFIKILLTLALCISEDGYLKLRTTLLNI